MFSIKNDKNLNKSESLDFNNCIYSNSISRPSKSLIDCEQYKVFTKLDLKSDIINEFSYITQQSKNKESLLLREIVNVFRIIDRQDRLDYNSLVMSFDTITINEFNNKNLIFSLDNDISIRNIIINLNLIIKEIEYGDDLIINFYDLYIYPSAELLVLISYLFDKIKIYYCKLIKQNLLYCYNYTNNNKVTVYLKNIEKLFHKNINIRQFGIFIDENIQNKIKKHNSYIFNYYINLSKFIINSKIEDKEHNFKKYLKKHHLGSYPHECNHEIVEFSIEECYICNKCFDLFMIY